jgi:Mg-chelatase subunit ChlD
MFACALALGVRAEPATAPIATSDVVEVCLSQLTAGASDAKTLQSTFDQGLKSLADAREQAQIGKTAPTEPAKRAIACRCELLEAELNRRLGRALPQKDTTRMPHLQRAAALYRSLRIVYRELPAAAAGYAGEARVLRDMGLASRSDLVLDPVILGLKSAKLENLSPAQLELQRLFWHERLENAKLRDPKEADALAKQIAESPLKATSASTDRGDLLLAIANSLIATTDALPTSTTAIASIQAPAGGMDDVLKDIRSKGLDVCFVIDATESMGPYIEQSKKRFADVVSIVTKLVGEGAAQNAATRIAPIRFGLVAFKDYGDDYGVEATRQLPLTGDTKKLQAAFDEVVAGGGGDVPEPIDQALRTALGNRMGWNRRRHNVIILVTDAPVHGTGRESAFQLASAFAKQLDGELNVIDVGGNVGGKRVRNTVLPDLNRIAENGHGSAFLLADDQAFWRHLIVSIFGQRYENDVQAIVDQYATPKK